MKKSISDLKIIAKAPTTIGIYLLYNRHILSAMFSFIPDTDNEAFL